MSADPVSIVSPIDAPAADRASDDVVAARAASLLASILADHDDEVEPPADPPADLPSNDAAGDNTTCLFDADTLAAIHQHDSLGFASQTLFANFALVDRILATSSSLDTPPPSVNNFTHEQFIAILRTLQPVRDFFVHVRTTSTRHIDLLSIHHFMRVNIASLLYTSLTPEAVSFYGLSDDDMTFLRNSCCNIFSVSLGDGDPASGICADYAVALAAQLAEASGSSLGMETPFNARTSAYDDDIVSWYRDRLVATH